MNKHSLTIHKINIRGLVFAFCFTWIMMLPACGVQSGINSADTFPTPLQEVETQSTAGVIIKATQHPTNKPRATHAATVTNPATIITTKSLASTAPTTMTPLSTPTLNAEELRQKWQRIDAEVVATMASNQGCQLPCWWGIKLGESSTNARQVFDSIDNNGWVDSNDQRGDLQQVGFFKHTYRNDIGEDIYAGFSVDLLTQEDLIKVIDISANRSISAAPGTPEYIQISERLLRDWEQYSVQSMFETFGEPEQINLLPRSFADGDNYFYEFNIYYPALGIVASYDFSLLDNDNGARTICLNMFDMDSMDLYLYDPTEKLPESYLHATYSLWPLVVELEPDEAPLVEFSDLESRTGMSIDEFATFILDDESDENCFSVT